MVISILNPKGGVGKTTTAIHVARALQVAGHSVALLDADIQGSALAWSALGALSPALAVSPARHDTLAQRVENLKPAPDYVVIDGAAKLEARLIAEALKVSDLVIIPVQPSALDIWGCAELVEAVRLRLDLVGKPKGAFLVTRQIIGSALAGDVQGALEAQGLPVLAARLSQRVAYPEAIAAGVTVLEHEPEGKAANEVRAMIDELLKL